MIKKKYPGATLGEVGKRAGEMWKALGDKSVSSALVSRVCARTRNARAGKCVV